MILGAGPAGLLATASTEPVGPAGWTLLQWAGCLLYLGLFAAALWGISRLGSIDGEDTGEDP
jgi:hypothetical protein